MGCGFIPIHWKTIITALKSGKKVTFEYHEAIWNEEYQCGWLHSLTPIWPKGFGNTIYGWENFEREVLESICNNYYAV
jgi:hypothetical protein